MEAFNLHIISNVLWSAGILGVFFLVYCLYGLITGTWR